MHPGYYEGYHHLRSVEGDLHKIADAKYDLKDRQGGGEDDGRRRAVASRRCGGNATLMNHRPELECRRLILTHINCETLRQLGGIDVEGAENGKINDANPE